MRFQVVKTPEILRDHIEYFWTMECEENEPVPASLKTFVKMYSGIIFQHHLGHSAFSKALSLSGRPVYSGELPHCYVYGQLTEPSFVFTKGGFSLCGALFRPQAMSTLLKIPEHELIDTLVDVHEFSGQNLDERLLNAEGGSERLGLLADFLIAKRLEARTPDLLVEASARRIRQDLRSIRVADLIQEFEVSERQLERRFLRATGVSPKFYTRVARFQESLRLMRTQRYATLTDIAHDLNYSDQAHFIKDIKEFSGCTPKTLSQSSRDFIASMQIH